MGEDVPDGGEGTPSALRWRFWRAGAGGLWGRPIAFESFRDLFTPDNIVHRLAEMRDEGWKPEHVAELDQLRPWMNRALARREINRRLQRQASTAMGRSGT